MPLTKADGDKLPASVAESTLDSLSVYVFNQHADTPYDSTTTIFVEEFKVGGDALTAAGANKVAQIQLSGLGKKKVYFVANAIGQHELDQLKLNVSTESDFLQMKTNLLTTSGQLACPLIMTAVDSVEITDDPASTSADGGGYTLGIGSTVTGREITLKRIVARFDIENQAETSDLVIEGIELNKVHPSALINKVQNFNATKHSEYAYTRDVLTETMNKFDFTRYPNANNGRAQSVFYVYPDLNKGDGTADEGAEADRFFLTLYGKTKKTGASVVYNVYMYKDNADRTKDPVIVKPNNQYLIKINDLDPTTLKATISVEDWLIGDTIDYEMSEGTIKLSCVEFPLVDVTPGPGQQLNIPASRGGTAATPVNVKVDAISEWRLLKGYNAEWIDTTTNINPDKLPVGTLTTVLPQEANPYNKERRGTLVFQNVQRPSIMQTLIVTQKAGAAGTVNIGKLSATDNANYLVAYRPDGDGTDKVGITEKADTLMLAGGGTPAFFTNIEYKNIEIAVDSTATTQEWSLSVDRIDSTWISITDGPVLNKQCKTFKVSLAKNDSVRRTGTIRLYDRQDETIYRDLVVVQEGTAVTAAIVTDPTYTVDTGAGFVALTQGADDQHYTVTFPKEKYTEKPYRIKLTTNGDWRIHDVADTEYRNWLDAYSLNKLDRRVMSGTGDAIIEIGTTANDSAAVRTGNVVLTIGNKDYTIAVTKLATTPSITLEDTHVTGNHIDFSSGDVAQGVKFICNDNWTVEAVDGTGAGVTTNKATWLHFSDASDATNAEITGGRGSTILRIAADQQTEAGGAGTGAAARSATVTIKCDNPTTPAGSDNPTIVLTIYQAGIEATTAP
ncbi:fimbrial protein [Parabacteroides faecis]|uniref:BACON domain-containing protein n=1 Tax=Parabacteroides faecis TaxID=1217282 RepID=UPI0021644B87|nr:BACON domain-containing carbohydrate-binding protein [Parabacteroides faecis]MCS2892069.1 fimbrial protein [Parabacteroides faecis]UVQ49289.1 fimbrial protein [Parabacteroides faecis]